LGRSGRRRPVLFPAAALLWWRRCDTRGEGEGEQQEMTERGRGVALACDQASSGGAGWVAAHGVQGGPRGRRACGGAGGAAMQKESRGGSRAYAGSMAQVLAFYRDTRNPSMACTPQHMQRRPTQVCVCRRASGLWWLPQTGQVGLVQPKKGRM
jgi:hypothetical protein